MLKFIKIISKLFNNQGNAISNNKSIISLNFTSNNMGTNEFDIFLSSIMNNKQIVKLDFKSLMG